MIFHTLLIPWSVNAHKFTRTEEGLKLLKKDSKQDFISNYPLIEVDDRKHQKLPKVFY